MRRLLALTTTAAALAMATAPATAHNEGIPSIPLDIHQMEHLQNIPNIGGGALAFFERGGGDGSVSRYLVAANTSHGFDILQVNEPAHPVVVGRYIGPDAEDPPNTLSYGPGFNNHPWVAVNPRRNIVALSIEDRPVSGRAPRHGLGVGVQFVDISNLADPKPLGSIDGLGPHTIHMLGDNHLYTSLSTGARIIDYTDPRNPTMKDNPVRGHAYWEDPNMPGIGYVGMEPQQARLGIMDLSDYANPTTIAERTNLAAMYAHEVYPSPDSSLVGVAEYRSGQTNVVCPGGGLWFHDISGKYTGDAGLDDPRLFGQWFIPFSGLTEVGTQGNNQANYASCTMHSWQPHPERMLGVTGMYAGGTWVVDYSGPTVSGGHYTEYVNTTVTPPRRTTWGNTQANVRDALDYVNAAQWMPFDLASSADERIIFTSGSARGVDVYQYTGPLPKKLSRLTVNQAATDGAATGKLERYAVLTHEGWQNQPLAGEILQVTVGETTVSVTTGEDGSFSADLGLAPGNHQVTVTWGGDDRFAENAVTKVVTA